MCDLTRAGSVLWHNCCVLERNSTFYSSDAIFLDVSCDLGIAGAGAGAGAGYRFRRTCDAEYARPPPVPRYHGTTPRGLRCTIQSSLTGGISFQEMMILHIVIIHMQYFGLFHTPSMNYYCFADIRGPVKCGFHLLTRIFHISHCRM